MRHRKKTFSFGRKAAQRNELFRGLAESLILHKRVETTEAKAKALRPIVEQMVTRGKNPSLANRRVLRKKLHNAKIVNILMDEIAPAYKDRNGGYTRIIKKGPRKGDGANTALIEFV